MFRHPSPRPRLGPCLRCRQRGELDRAGHCLPCRAQVLYLLAAAGAGPRLTSERVRYSWGHLAVAAAAGAAVAAGGLYYAVALLR